MLPVNKQISQQLKAAESAVGNLDVRAMHIRVGVGGVIITLTEADFRKKFAGCVATQWHHNTVEYQCGEITYETQVRAGNSYPQNIFLPPVAEAACDEDTVLSEGM